MKKNDIITLDITAVSSEGSGVGRHNGMTVFVKPAAFGDVLSVRIIYVGKRYAIGRPEAIISASTARIDSECASFPACGGCAYQHISYDAELRNKQQRVQDALSRIGGLDIKVDPIVAADRLHGYRNKAQYPVGMTQGGLNIGFFAERSHRIVNSRQCLLSPPEFSDILNIFERFITEQSVSIYDETTGKGLLRHIYCRKAEATGQIMVCAVINGDRLPKSDVLIRLLSETLGDRLKTVVLNINKANTNVILSDECLTVYGDGYITDVLCGIKVRLSALSFYQVNRSMAERLYGIAADFAQPEGKTLLDLYCGAGTIGLSMAGRAQFVYGAEIVPEAVTDAVFNAEQNGITNARFLCADALDAAKRLEADGLSPDVVIVDPPRKGLTSDLPRLIADRLSPERVVYISCDPATLARDCALFDAAGYKTVRAVPVDLFPRTHHVETAALLMPK